MKNIRILLSFVLISVGSAAFSQVQVDKFTGDVNYGLPLITVPNFKGPSVSTSISYRSDIKVDQPASEVGLGWNMNAGGSIERSVNGVPDDWKDVFVPDMQTASFQNHLGSLHFNSTHTSTILDFDYTRFKMDTLNDTLRYYYPNYDSYYVVGAGMSGKIVPENYSFPNVEIDTTEVNRWFYNQDQSDSLSIGIKETETYTIDSEYPFEYKTHFQYEHNLYDTVESKAYPWSSSPIDLNSSVYVPYDSISPTYQGNGYNNENYSVEANRNRTRASNYIEYFTNEQIDTNGVLNFLEYDTAFNRSVESNFPQDGIGAFRITDPNGYTYHYSLPVYAHHYTVGNYSLDGDYNVFIAPGGYMNIQDSTNGYIVENELTHEILKLKQIKKYAIRWLLTAITGPDYNDSNSDGMVSDGDDGYWVKYDYGLWTEQFEKRSPYYGSSYNFSSIIDDQLDYWFLDKDHIEKSRGRMMSYFGSSEQVYKLKQIKTPSHTGVFCWDYRFDEQSTPLIHNPDGNSQTLDNEVDSAYSTYESGDALLNSDHPGASFSHTFLVEPSNFNSNWDLLDMEFVLYNCNLANEFSITIYDGDQTSDPVLLYRENDDGNGSFPGAEGGTYNFTATSGQIMIKIDIDTVYYDAVKDVWSYMTYDATWSTRWDNALAGWPNGRQKTIPNLKLSKLFLFDNDDLSSLAAISAMDTITNDKLWDYTKVDRDVVYSSDWYSDNSTNIDTLALQSVDLVHDYSLAKKYHNNKFVLIDTLDPSTTQKQIEEYKYVATNSLDSSGKLTLNKVTYYGLNHSQTQPGHLFSYSANDTAVNPYYNPLKQDYWGNYKVDADLNLLRGYVSDTSSLYNDAWSLRQVTSPLGGTTEIVYESDEYEQVLGDMKGDSMRGPIKTFELKEAYPVSGDVGGQWTIELENQVSDFWRNKDSLPTGAIAYASIPCVWVDGIETQAEERYFDYGGLLGFASSYGSATLTESGSTVDGLNFLDINSGTETPPIDSSSHFIWNGDEDSLVYSGGGYISFEYPIGEKIKGGGTRVKEIKVSNGAEEYSVSYTYDEGTATLEAGDFGSRKSKEDLNGDSYPWVLVSPDYNPFGLSPQVGYGQVTIENIGQVSSGQGKSVFNFYVSDDGLNNSEPYYGIQDTTWKEHLAFDCGPFGQDSLEHESRRLGIEVVDDFSTLWGKIREQKLSDINNTLVSRKVYEYESSEKGAHTEVLCYKIGEGSNSNCHEFSKYLIGIKRKYPNYLSKVTTYSNGRSSSSEIIERDPITGDPTETKNTSVNRTVTNEIMTPAYTQTSSPDYTELGAKSVDPSYNNFLNASYASKTLRASETLSTSDFSSYGKSFWRDTVRVRYYNSTDNEYEIIEDSVIWYDYTKYAWTGPLGDYGIFDNDSLSEITSPPSGDSHWRFISEVSLMDEQENVLEQRGFNNRFSALKLGYDNRFTYTSASNSNYVSFTATGFETETEVETGVYYYEGEVKKQTGNTQLTQDGSVYPHTGNYMIEISSGNQGPLYHINFDSNDSLYSLQLGRTYNATVWVHANSPSSTKLNMTLEGDTNATTYSTSDTMSISNENATQIGNWVRLEVNLEVPINFTGETSGDGLKIYVDGVTGSDAWVDDMLFHSRVSGSGMNVYDQRTGRVMATISDNNFATKYVYNDAGQVIEVWKEVLGDGWSKWVKVESRAYNFKRDLD